MTFGQALAVLLLSAAAVGERPNLTGVVKGPDNKPLPGATVFIYTAHPRSGTSTTCPSCYLDCRKRAETNRNGEFAIPTVDPALLFRVGAIAEGHQSSFRDDVDPSAGPITITLGGQPPLPENPRRLLRARLLDADGAPVFGALVEAVGYEIRGKTPGGWQDTFGPIGVDPAITGTSGTLNLAVPREVDSLFLGVEARGLAPKVFARVPTGAQVNELRLGPGRAIKGRLVHLGQPVSGAVIGGAQASRSAETFVGERTAETDTDGRFLLLNLPPAETLVVYGKVESLGKRGAVAEREIPSAAEGSVLDLGEITLEPGVLLSGQVVLADGKAVPPHTRIALARPRTWDTTERELAPDGTFDFGRLPRETVTLSVRLRGYELAPENESLLPDPSDRRESLAGRLEQDARLRVLLTPVVKRTPPPPPHSGLEWQAMNARQDAVRSRPRRGAPSTP